MGRLVAFDAIFFLLPFLVYAGWLLATRRNLGGAADWSGKILLYLTLGGALVLLGAIVAFITFSTGEPGTKYVPARVENGVIVPGHFE